MSIISAFGDALVADADISAAVGTRIRHGYAEEDMATPFIVFARSATEKVNHLERGSGREFVQLDVSIYDLSSTTALSISDDIREAFDNLFTLDLGGTGQLAVCHLQDEYTTVIPRTSFGHEKFFYRILQRWRIFTSESVVQPAP